MSYSYSYLKTPQFRAFIRMVASGPKARFLDIGPVHPGGQSITTPLYEMGWQGINIEPVKAYLDYLKKVRHSDIHLQGVVCNDNQELTIQDFGPLGYRLQKATDSSASDQTISHWSIQQLLEQNHLPSIEVLHLDSRAIFNPETFHLDFYRIKPWLIILENFTASVTFQTALDLHYQQVLTQPHLTMLIAKDQTQLLQSVMSLKDAGLADLSRQSAFQFSLGSWLIPKIKSRLKSPRIIRIAKDIKIIIEEERVIQTGLRVVRRKLKSTAIGKKLQRFKNRNSPLPAHYYDELPPLQTHSEQSLQLLEQLKAKQATIFSSKG